MKYTEIKKIALIEAGHEDSIYDIGNKDLSRLDLWISAFCVGYEIAKQPTTALDGKPQVS